VDGPVRELVHALQRPEVEDGHYLARCIDGGVGVGDPARAC
jgi:hypothetical protein